VNGPPSDRPDLPPESYGPGEPGDPGDPGVPGNLSERDDSILDRNLENLLRRAYSPVLPRPEFRAALRARVLLSRGFVETATPRKRRIPRFVAAALILGFASGFAAIALHLLTRSAADAPSTGEPTAPILDDAPPETPTVGDPPSRPTTDRAVVESSTPAPNDRPDTLPAVRGVVTAYGRPVESFRVACVRYEKRPGQPDYEVTHRSFETGATQPGVFEFDEPLEGMIRFFVEADDLAVAASDTFWLLPGDPPQDLEFELVSGGTLRGRVVDANTGEPQRNALVFSENEFGHPAIPWSEGALATFSGMPPRGVRTDAGGRYELEHVSPVSTLLRAKALYRVPQWKSVAVLDGATIEGIDFSVLPGARIEGQTRDDSGAPVAGAVIVAVNQTLGVAAFDQPMAVGYTRSDGRFEITDLPSGVYTVLDLGVHASRFDPDRMRLVEVGLSGTLHVEFGPASGDARVVGRLLDELGAPIAHATLSLSEESSLETNISQWRSGITDDEGRFTVDRLTPGRYDVYRVFGSVSVVAIGSAVVAAGVETQIELRGSGVALAGTVVDAVDGSPVPDAFLILQWVDPASGKLLFSGRCPVDAGGSFRLENVKPGAYRIGVVGKDARHGATVSDPIAADASTHHRLVLPRGGSAMITFEDADPGTPTFSVIDGNGVDLTGLCRTQPHGKNGISLGGLPVGVVTISIRDEGFERLETRIRIDEGHTTQATIELTRRR